MTVTTKKPILARKSPMSEFDGFFFTPGDNDNQIDLSFFRIKSREMGQPIESTKMGDMFHVAFFRKGETGHPEFDDEFEAIFADPEVYVKNLIGANVYGTFLRKTEHSGTYWKEYLDDAKKKCSIIKLKFLAESIAESKK